MRVRSLSLIAVGVALVALDYRIVGSDVLPDPVGWVLVALGAAGLSRTWPAVLAGVAAAASVVDVVAPHHYDALDPLTGEVVTPAGPGLAYHERLAFDRLQDGRLLLAVVAVAAGGAALVLLLGELARRARATGDTLSASRLRSLRAAVALVWALPYLVAAGVAWRDDGSFDPVWNGGLELVALAGLIVMAVLAVYLAGTSNRIWTAPPGEPLTPWTRPAPDRHR
jgi:hypothetical protein